MRYLALLAFFGSGLSSLILENLWVRMLTLVFGGTTLAVVTVLTVFMGGLALGSHLAGRYIHHIQRPLRWYAYLEACIAIYATIFPWFVGQLPGIYHWIPEDWPFLATGLFRFALCLLLLIVPTTLMGATLPVLSQHFVRNPDTIGEDAGLLYSVNTLGAVTGAVLGGFVLMPLLGNTTTLWTVTTCLFLMAVCLIVYDVFVHPSSGSASGLEHSLSSVEEQEDVSWGTVSRDELYAALTPHNTAIFQRMILVAIAVTGASAMLCQVVWSRTLAMIIGSSTYAFTLILSLFLMGLALGAAYGARLTRRSLDVFRSWIHLLLWTALLVALGSFCFDALPGLFIRIALRFPEDVSPFALFQLKTIIAAIPVLLPTFCMGTFFPLALALYSPQHRNVGQRVGQLYTFNTIGAIVGSFATGFVIVPWIGLQHGLTLAVFSYLVCVLFLLLACHHPQRHWYGVVCVAGCLVVFLLPTWNHGLMSLGTFRLSSFQNHTFREAVAYSSVLFYKEGVSATVSVEGTASSRTLKINGKPEASTAGDRPTQIAIAAVPLALHRKPEDVLLIGWGSGMTAGAALHFPLRQLVAVELEPVVIEAARWMEPWNFRPHQHKNLQIRYNDGRNYLATTSRQFDVIISEPSNPWISGVSNLFTREYFELVRRRLRPGGIFCQWVQLYEISSANVTSILRAIHQEFPYVRVFEVNRHDTDTFVIATKHPWQFDLQALEAVITAPRYRKLFYQAMMVNAHDILPRFLMGEKDLGQLFKKVQTPANTDDYNRLEFTAPLDLVRASATSSDEPFQQTVELLNNPWPAYIATEMTKLGSTRAEFWLRISEAYLRYGNIQNSRLFLTKATQLAPKMQQIPRTLRILRLLDRTEGEPLLPSKEYVLHLLQRYGKKIRRYLRRYLEAHTLFEKKQYAACLEKFRPLGQNTWLARWFPQVHYYHGICAHHKNLHLEAFEALSRYVHDAKP